MTEESTFKLWANEDMTTEFGTPTALGRQTNIAHNGTDSQEFVFYLGSNATGRKLQTLKNPGHDILQVQTIDILPERVSEQSYEVGQLIEPELNNGFVYQCVNAGVSAKVIPAYPVGIGSEVTDREAIFRNVGAKHLPTEVRLALSKDGLNTAKAGVALPLAAELPSGAAIAIYVRVTNGVGDVYNSVNTPILALNLNDCVEVAR